MRPEMLSSRPVDLEADREIILDFHCLGNYETDTLVEKPLPFAAYRARWLATSQPDCSSNASHTLSSASSGQYSSIRIRLHAR